MFAAARYSFALGWKGVVVAEVFGGRDGAGWTIKFWYDAHRAHGVVGYAFFFMIFAVVFERLVFDSLAKRVFKWRPAVTGVAVGEDDFEAEVAAAAPAVAATASTGSARG
jgi:ABC-type nitrate/sulfonate/bicarbonate transport system permease component